MVLRRFIVRDFVDFTASIEEQPLNVAPGTYIDHWTIAYKGDLAATATQTLPAFLDLVSKFSYKVNGVPRIDIGGRDIFALNYLALKNPVDYIVGAAGEDMKVFGMTFNPLYIEAEVQIRK